MNVLNLDTGSLSRISQSDSKMDRTRLENALKGQDPCDDVFSEMAPGQFAVLAHGRILAGHFGNTPVVPGVLIKRLFLLKKGINTYERGKAGWVRWTFDFLAPLVPGMHVSFVDNADGSVSLVSGDKTIARAEKKLTDSDWYIEGPAKVLSAIHSLEKVSQDEIDTLLLQNAPFRFVDNADFVNVDKRPLHQNGDVFYGKFHTSDMFHFAQGSGVVYPEIVEEAIAQIGSLALARRIGPKSDQRQIVTFSQSIIGGGGEPLVRNDTLAVAWRILRDENNERRTGFRYNAYNDDGGVVLQWEIWGNILPFAMLEKIVQRTMKTSK